MQHKDYLIDLLDPAGQVIGQKPRRDVVKRVDRYNAVHTFMMTPGREVVLSRIPERQDLPNVYFRRLGTAVATIRQSNETAEAAARRSLEQELFMPKAKVTLMGEGMFDLPDGYKALVSGFVVMGEPPEHYSTSDIESLKLMPMSRFISALQRNPERFSATLLEWWRRWGEQVLEA